MLADGGDFVSRTDRELRVNVTSSRRFPSVNSAGLLLPQWRQARMLRDGELLIGSFLNRSFESRFSDPIRTGQVLSVY